MDKEGQLLFHPLNRHYLLQGSPSLVPRDEVRVLTFNHCLIPQAADFLFDTPCTRDRLKEFVERHLQKFDIVCFQECYASLQEAQEWLLQEAQKRGYFFHARSSQPGFFKLYNGDAGLLILSRFEIECNEALTFSYNVGIESVSEMGALYAKIIFGTERYTLHLFNAHLQSATDYSNHEQLMRSAKCKMDQARELSKFIEAKVGSVLGSEGEITLLCGDFNVNAVEYSQALQQLILKGDERNTAYLKEVSNEYEDLINQLTKEEIDVVDIFLEQRKQHVPTFVFSSFDRKILAESKDTSEALDYIFQVIQKESQVEESNSTAFSSDKSRSPSPRKCKSTSFGIKPDSVQVEQFMSDDSRFVALSDHFGISFGLQVPFH